LFHVQGHFLIIEAHDLYETFEGADLNCNGRILSCFANDLHDVISLALTFFMSVNEAQWDSGWRGAHIAFKVLTNKLKRVEESMDGSQLDFSRRFILPGTMNNGCEDLVVARAENLRFLVRHATVKGRFI
jgi:hypothetical protein